MRYRSFLLRVWQRNDLNGSEWAGSLESIQAPGEWRFHTLEELLEQLRQLAGSDAVQQAPGHEAMPPDESPSGARQPRHGTAS